MEWGFSNDDDKNDIINFMMENEWLNIQALSLFSNNDDSLNSPKIKFITLQKRVNNTIDSLIIITSKGLIYPIFSINSRWSNLDKQELIKFLGSIKLRVHGVIGLEEDVNFFDSILFNRIRGSNNYFILKRPNLNPFILNREFDIKKAKPLDLNRLVNLEYEYQKEEVLLNPLDLNKKVSKENFKNKLKTDDIYYVDSPNIPLSKAGTTSKSFNYTLIGGVFTWKEKRNLGYARELLKYLINDQIKKGFMCALFVKRDNPSALHLYKKLGFIEPRPYKINYYYN